MDPARLSSQVLLLALAILGALASPSEREVIYTDYGSLLNCCLYRKLTRHNSTTLKLEDAVQNQAIMNTCR
jgi:hypothetical protein